MTDSLTAEDFPKFFQALHGTGDDEDPDPFPWQRRLVRRVAGTGTWPELLDLPTGSGKTAALDAAVFLLALRGDQPRRIVFVVDRRIVVHQAADRARHIKKRLREAREGVLFTVAQRLRDLANLGDEQPPLEYAELRGGIVRDNEWARRPDVVTVIVSTVDQVGSRLLFRGYGVSSGMRPVHAGLLGNDVLYLLDEVHLARPFADTLAAIHRYYRPPEAARLPDRFSVVELSATPSGHVRDDVLHLVDDDYKHDVLARRLNASKRARVKLVKVSGSDPAKHRAELAAAAVGEARALLDREGVRTVGVVVNRVDTAARVYRLLGEQGIGAVLLTGRMRPLDRDRLLKEHEDRLRTGRTRDDDAAPLVLVATQAVEAGADIDLDGLVTECAPLDVLVQRFGRVDRDGRCTERGNPAASVILATSADVATAEDRVYGDRLRLTWAWLRERPLDFGINAFRSAIDVKTRTDLSTPPSEAPYLMPSHLDRWVQTSATPDADPDPAHWLHGVQPGSPEVNVVWRADVLPGAFPEPGAAGNAIEKLVPLVSLCPPGSGEAMSLPLWAVRAWLADVQSGTRAVVSFSDTALDGAGDADAPGGAPAGVAPALNWRGDTSTVVSAANDIHAGDTLVVPATYGGIRASNWDPIARETVPDLGMRVQADQRARAVLRLYEELPVGDLTIPPTPVDPDQDDEVRDIVIDWLGEWASRIDGLTDTDPLLLKVINALRNPKTVSDVDVVEIAPSGPDGQPPKWMFVIRSRRRVPALGPRYEPSADSEPATSSFLGAKVALHQHLCDVERWTRRLGEACGLRDPVLADLALAGRLHDLGKVDPRFQRILRAGEVGAESEPLAKSVLTAANYRARRRAERAARYPARTRHELASVALVEHDQQLRETANDWDLVLHLIASHHGYARPVVPVSVDTDPQRLRVELDGRVLEAGSDHGLLRLDSGVPQRFWRCVRRYGWFGLAWLEAVLRLADHRASEERSA
ncbi:MAG TPA: type I-U CRISPR-associated helicase/endonuclease Cas3 [Pseudonocardiaceae bacterium]|nr:type I-U CRISPR-associated helicase/endonuclease Cas3 [Pseudonocardiaceae bacterium]